MDAECEECGVDLRLQLSNRDPHTWQILAPPLNALTQLLTDEDLRRLTEKLSRYQVLGQKWERFKSKRRESDQLWRYVRDDSTTAIAMVREGVPIAQFGVFGNL